MESSKFNTSFIDLLIIEILYFSAWESIGFRGNVQEYEFQFLSLSPSILSFFFFTQLNHTKKRKIHFVLLDCQMTLLEHVIIVIMHLTT